MFDQLKCIFMDLDGTIVDAKNRRLSVAFAYKIVRQLSKRGTWLQGIKALGAVKKSLELPADGRRNDVRASAAFDEIYSMGLEKADDALFNTVSLVFPELEKYFFPVPGAPQFVKWARERYRLILATQPIWPESIIRTRLSWSGVPENWFESVTHARRMHSCKPFLSYFEELLEQEKLEPSQVMMIGNEVRNDLVATRLGIPVFLVDPKMEKMEPILLKNRPAKGWRGNYQHLQQLLNS